MSALAHWQDQKTESMYDKHWLALEVELIKERIRPGSSVLDMGCRDGECSVQYAEVAGSLEAVDIVLIDCIAHPRVDYKEGDVRDPVGKSYDCVISQRCIINLASWDEQKTALGNLAAAVKPGGKLLLCEGSKDGQRELNAVRQALELPPINEASHNIFLEDEQVRRTLMAAGMYLQEETGIGAYHLLTRAIQPFFVKKPDWRSAFNKLAASKEMRAAMGFHARFSRIKLWVFSKP